MTRPLAELTTLALGGPAERLVEARAQDELVDAVLAADAAGEELLVLGGGSNVVIADEGFAGTVVLVRTTGVKRSGDRLEVAAGEPWDALAAGCAEAGLAGIECLAGIPGSVGATPIQNVGAYGQEVAEVIAAVRVLDRTSGELTTLGPQECGFAYRSSLLKREPGRRIVLSVTYALKPSQTSGPIRYAELARALDVPVGGRAPLAEVRAAVLELRRAKGMVLDDADPDTRSAGSFFTNPILAADAFAALRAGHPDAPGWPEPDGRVKTSAAWLIEQAGHGRGDGEAEGIAISTKHALALTNRGAGTATELVAFARRLADAVWERFAIVIEPEPVLVGLDWR